jgi:release factor glutamine methyltransferase
LYVDENVLIPRPETEELVDWIKDFNPPEHSPLLPGAGILDIGTGSGCIAIALKIENPSISVSACDISESALNIARRNAVANTAGIIFFNFDILDKTGWEKLAEYDIIVSNPPYIPVADRVTMDKNVLLYEPALALFTTDEDPYIFYRTIALFGQSHLVPGGKLFFEIHENGGDAVFAVLQNHGYKNIKVKNDLFGRPRMVTATKG